MRLIDADDLIERIKEQYRPQDKMQWLMKLLVISFII